MDPVTPFDWHRMFIGNEPPLFFLEIVFRAVVIYLFAALVLRLMGKRGNRKMAPFDYVVIIALGSATGDAMFYPDVPILYAWVVIGVVVVLNQFMASVQLRSQRANSFVEGDPRLFIREGRVLAHNLRQEQLRQDEFFGMLREHGVKDTGEVEYAFFERSGQIGLLRYPEGEERAGLTTLPSKVADAERLQG